MHSEIPTVMCVTCKGQGARYYPTVATWRQTPQMVSGRAMTFDVCDECWGSGSTSHPGQNLREAATPRVGMSDEQIRFAVEECDRRLTQVHVFEPQRFLGASPNRIEAIKHLRWMYVEIHGMLPDKRDKAFRWLGFMQGAMWALELQTIDEARKANMSPTKEFKERS